MKTEILYKEIPYPATKPEKKGWYGTDKGKLYWYESEACWSCRDDRLSEEYPTLFYKPIILPEREELPDDEEIENQDFSESIEIQNLNEKEQIYCIAGFKAGAKWMRKIRLQKNEKDISYNLFELLHKFIIYYEDFFKNGNPYKHLPLSAETECVVEFMELPVFQEYLTQLNSEIIVPGMREVEFLLWVAGNNYHQLNGTVNFRQAESGGIEMLSPKDLYIIFKSKTTKK